jgi:phosphatidylserine synthase
MKLSLDFLDCWEYAIFNKYGKENYCPASTFTGKLIVWAAGILAITIVVLNFTSYDQSASNTAVGVIFGIAFLITAWNLVTNILELTTVGAKIGYAAYMLVLFALSSAIFIALAFFAMFIVIAVLALWLVWFLATNYRSR